ncbi:hypothetical protein CSAL01_13394 [Colletotrichum salicis]|uniref:C2H2-type domain-containing protein n=1 Tax=Colletotrichum salicis TaxID=1209931 RepID=A0A135SD94_9PEZI|nr:hypothetical protein CSAL01_13394 [Colletotrichum salicis]
MCFYRQSIWACGHWEWGPVGRRCSQNDVEVGGCRNKLVFAATSQPTECIACSRIFQKGFQLEALYSRVEEMLRGQARPTTLGIVVRDMDKLYLELQQAKAEITSQGLIATPQKGHSAQKQRPGQFFRCHWCGVQFYREEYRTEHIFMYHQSADGQRLRHSV